MASTHRGLRPDEALLLVALAGIWGASFLFIKVALDDVGPVALVAVRLLVAAAGIGAWLVARRGVAGIGRGLVDVSLFDAVVLAVTGAAVPFTCIAWAETRITSSLAGILNAAVPLLTALLALRFDPDNRIRGWRNLGLVVGFAGVALVAGSDIGASPAGVAAMLGAAASYAASAHFARLRFGGVDPAVVAFVQTAMAAVIVVPLALAFDLPDRMPDAESLAALLALGLAGTAVAWVLYYRLVAQAGPQHAVAVTYLVPIAAVFYGAVILDEVVTWVSLAGAAIIIAGQVVVAAPGRAKAVDEPVPGDAAGDGEASQHGPGPPVGSPDGPRART